MSILKRRYGCAAMSERSKNQHRRMRREFDRLVIAYQHLMTPASIDLLQQAKPSPQQRHVASLLKQLLLDLDVHVEMLEQRAPAGLRNTAAKATATGRRLSKADRMQLELAGAGTFAHLLRDSRRMLILAREQAMPLLALAAADDERPPAGTPEPTRSTTVIEIDARPPRD